VARASPTPSRPIPYRPGSPIAQDLAAVLDEVGAERAALLAEIDAGPTAIFFAATQPERTSALILSHTTARFVAADDYPIGIPAEVAETLLAQMDQFWGSEAMVAPSEPATSGFAVGWGSWFAPAPARGPPSGSCGRSWRPTCAPPSP
jgi:pimeloyl-ACP methyl ester carboxylesterase